MTAQVGNIFSNSAEAMAALLALHFPRGTILDTTAGPGVFYRKVRRRIVRGDIRLDIPIDYLGDCRCLPFLDDSFTVAVIDPPYKRGSRNHATRDYYTARYGLAPHTEPQVTRVYQAALPELIRVSRRGIIIKCQDASDGHTFHPRHVRLCDLVRTLTGLELHDYAMVVRETVPMTLVQGRQHYFRQHVSYFLIWKWTRKHPFRSVHF